MQNLKGIIPDKAIQVITQLQASITSLSTNFSSLAAKGVLTPKQAGTSYGSAAQRKELQASGKTPMNVSGLPGLLGQPQFALANNQATAPSAGPGSQPGTIVTINNVISQVISPGSATPLSAQAVFLEGLASAIPAVASVPANAPYFETDRNWLYIALAGVWTYMAGVMVGLAAGMPGGLGAGDTNALYLTTDTLLFYYWSGSAWVKVPVNTVAAGTYGDSTHVAQPVVDAYGRVTAINSIAIAAVGGPPTGPAGGDLTGTYPNPGVDQVNGAALPASASLVGTDSSRRIAAAPNPTVATITVTPVTVATLPGSPILSQEAAVTDALAPAWGVAVVGGGAAFAAVKWNGAQWSVFSK